jgi:hypothetical protein
LNSPQSFDGSVSRRISAACPTSSRPSLPQYPAVGWLKVPCGLPKTHPRCKPLPSSRSIHPRGRREEEPLPQRSLACRSRSFNHCRSSSLSEVGGSFW